MAAASAPRLCFKPERHRWRAAENGSAQAFAGFFGDDIGVFRFNFGETGRHFSEPIGDLDVAKVCLHNANSEIQSLEFLNMDKQKKNLKFVWEL